MRTSLGKYTSVWLVLPMLLSCGQGSNEGLEAASSQAVVVTEGYPAVVEVILPNGAGLCSGTFIGRRAVLTAAHCAKTAGTYRILSSFGAFTTSVRETFGRGVVNDPNDIAVLVLDSDVASNRLAQILPLGQSVSRLDRVRIVGYGCDDVNARTGLGTKRTGTNQIAEIDDFLNLETPQAAVGILGPVNRAASCFGDSGGPMLRSNGKYLEVVGVVHAGGSDGENQVSLYANLTRDDNRGFLQTVDAKYGLHLFEPCSPDGDGCFYDTASTHIFAALAHLWGKVATFLGSFLGI